MEEKYIPRYESFCNSLDALNEAKHRDLSDSFVLSGTAAKFCITMELAWKVMKDILSGYHMLTDFPKGSPREVMQKAFEVGLIHDEVWLAMLRIRNELAHDYDNEIIQEQCDNIVNRYIDVMYQFKGEIQHYYE